MFSRYLTRLVLLAVAGAAARAFARRFFESVEGVEIEYGG